MHAAQEGDVQCVHVLRAPGNREAGAFPAEREFAEGQFSVHDLDSWFSLIIDAVVADRNGKPLK